MRAPGPFQARVLGLLSWGPLTLREIADATLRDITSVSSALLRMASRGLVVRYHSTGQPAGDTQKRVVWTYRLPDGATS